MPNHSNCTLRAETRSNFRDFIIPHASALLTDALEEIVTDALEEIEPKYNLRGDAAIFLPNWIQYEGGGS